MKEFITSHGLLEIKKDSIKKGEATEGNNDYIIAICNMSNWIVTQIKYENGQVFPYSPPIGKTCGSHDYPQCVAAKSYQAAALCQCTDRAFGVFFHLKHPKGYEGDTAMVTITPDCTYAGTIIGLDIPDPH
jgi:hypothetical protein